MPGIDPYSDEAPPEFAAVRSGEDLDWKRIEAYLRANLPLDLAIEANSTSSSSRTEPRTSPT